MSSTPSTTRRRLRSTKDVPPDSIDGTVLDLVMPALSEEGTVDDSGDRALSPPPTDDDVFEAIPCASSSLPATTYAEVAASSSVGKYALATTTTVSSSGTKGVIDSSCIPSVIVSGVSDVLISGSEAASVSTPQSGSVRPNPAGRGKNSLRVVLVHTQRGTALTFRQCNAVFDFLCNFFGRRVSFISVNGGKEMVVTLPSEGELVNFPYVDLRQRFHVTGKEAKTPPRKGVIYDVPSDISDEDMLAMLKSQGVTSCRLLPGRVAQGGEHVPGTAILEFGEGKPVPSHVDLGFLKRVVKAYIPPPTTCYRCFRTGHVAKSCRHALACGNCGGAHDNKVCRATFQKCARCGGAHRALDSRCPVRARERKEHFDSRRAKQPSQRTLRPSSAAPSGKGGKAAGTVAPAPSADVIGQSVGQSDLSVPVVVAETTGPVVMADPLPQRTGKKRKGKKSKAARSTEIPVPPSSSVGSGSGVAHTNAKDSDIPRNDAPFLAQFINDMCENEIPRGIGGPFTDTSTQTPCTNKLSEAKIEWVANCFIGLIAAAKDSELSFAKVKGDFSAEEYECISRNLKLAWYHTFHAFLGVSRKAGPGNWVLERPPVL